MSNKPVLIDTIEIQHPCLFNSSLEEVGAVLNGNMDDKLVEAWLKSKTRVVMTGAGASVPSGIPDFRGPQGLWRKMDPKIFSIDRFFQDPGRAWKMFIQLFDIIKKARPNTVHRTLALLEKKGLVDAVITQNIDGLHQKAGSIKVLELHGYAYRTRCLKCDYILPTIRVEEKVLGGMNPVHEGCGGLLKPDIVYFGEKLPKNILEEAYRVSREADFFLVIGSSLAVQPASLLPLVAKDSGAFLAIINMGRTEQDDIADLKMEGDAAILMQLVYEKIVRALR